MTKYSNNDHYLDPQTGILKNRLGIVTEDELEKAEATFVGIRSYALANDPIKGAFDLEHLKAIHRFLFGDIYEWAGQCRDIDIAKGNHFFAHHPHIEAAAQTLFQSLAEEKHLAGLSVSDFAERAAFYLGEINALHPFREGNGRAQREFISHLAYANGYVIEWKNLQSDTLVQASIDSFKGDYAPFATYMRANLKPLGKREES